MGVHPLWLDLEPRPEADDREGRSPTGLFGFRVALSSNGKTAVVSGPGDNGGAGAAWVFSRSGSTWTQQGPS